MSLTRSKDNNPEQIGKKKKKRRMANPANRDNPINQQEESNGGNPADQQEDNNEDNNRGGLPVPASEKYLDNTPLSESLRKGIEDKIIVECPKLKDYYRVDTLLIHPDTERVHLYTNEEVETFPVHCPTTKFSVSLLAKVLKGAVSQRAATKG